MADGLGAAEALDAAWRRLGQRWEHTNGQWDDAVQREFDAEFMAPLEAEVPATLKAMATLAEVVGQARVLGA